MSRKSNVWYTVRDGNFNDSNTWISNAKRKYKYPQPGDDIHVRHNMTFTIIGGLLNVQIRNIYVMPQGKILFSNTGGTTVISVMGDIQVDGYVDMTGATGFELAFYGVNNYINNFIGIAGTISYYRSGDQDIMGISYNKLIIGGSGYKNINTILTVGGTTIITGSPQIVNRANNKITFIGNLSTDSGTLKASFDNSISADIEFRGGISIDTRSLTTNFGLGTLYFNGTQSIQWGGGAPYHLYTNCIIMGSSIVTVAVDNPHQSPLVVHGIWNGDSTSSTLNIDGVFWQAIAIEPMSTGVFGYNHGVNSEIGYVFDGNYTLPYNSYVYLSIQGTGTKTLSSNTTLTKLLTITAGGSLEVSSFDLTVEGNFIQNSGSFTKNSSIGYTKFKGLVSLSNTLIFAFNNACTIEFQNGLSYDQGGAVPFFVSGVLLKFTTNNQSIINGHSSVARWPCDILISGAITVTNQLWGFGISGTINGDNAGSTFDNVGLFSYKNAQQPMQTGVLISNHLSTSNQFIYELIGDQDIKSGTYSNLTLQGSGVKKLLGNVSVLNTYILSSPVTLNTNGYTLTNP